MFNFGGVVSSNSSWNLLINPLFQLLKGKAVTPFVEELEAAAPIEIIFCKSGVIFVIRLKSLTKLDAPVVGLYPINSNSANLGAVSSTFGFEASNIPL